MSGHPGCDKPNESAQATLQVYEGPYFGLYGQEYCRQESTPRMSQNSTNDISVITIQPPATLIPLGKPPDNHLGLAIYSCLCCCFPIGIVAIVFSCMASRSVKAGDYKTARTRGEISAKFSRLSIGLGSVIIIVSLIVTSVFGLSKLSEIDDLQLDEIDET